MSEYIYIPDQDVTFGSNVIFNDLIPCTRKNVYHRNSSGDFTLRGNVNNPCCGFARYKVVFRGNVAVPTGGTVGEISLSVAIGTEALTSSLSASTPTAAEAFNHISPSAVIDVPAGCCSNIGIRNTSATGETITVRNARLEITRIA